MEQGDQDIQIKEWVKQVLNPILQGNMPNAEIISQLGGIALLSAGTDKIKEYVFESAKLPEIRGASMILDDLNQGWPQKRNYQPFDSRLPSNLREIFLHHGLPTRWNKKDKQDDCIIYAGGGSLLALVPPALAETLKAEIENLYPKETSVATISCVWQPIAIGSDEKIDLSEIIARQSLLLRRAKEQRNSLPFFEAIPFARRCESCQIRPAIRQVPPDERWLCQPCMNKVKRSWTEAREKNWVREFVEELNESNAEAYLRGYGSKKDVLDNVEVAEDLNEIALASRDKRSIGFIYADGNDIGSILENPKTKKPLYEYQQKSEILHGAMRSAVFNALGCHLRITPIPRQIYKNKPNNIKIHPFQIIAIGGDDALIIVPGDRALDVAISLGKVFEMQLSKEKELFDRQITLSVGLVVADCHNPVYFLHHLAEDLLKNAKKKSRKTSTEGAMDFLVIKSQTALSTDLSNLREHYPWTIESHGENAILTGRPYTWSEMIDLRYTVQEIHGGLPRTQLQALCRSLRKGRLASTMFYRYQWARADNQRKDLFARIERNWGVESINSPWIKLKPKNGKDRYSTMWEDIRELNDLIPILTDAEWQRFMQEIGRRIGGEPIHAS